MYQYKVTQVISHFRMENIFVLCISIHANPLAQSPEQVKLFRQVKIMKEFI